MKEDYFKRDQLTNSECRLNFKAAIHLFLSKPGMEAIGRVTLLLEWIRNFQL